MEEMETCDVGVSEGGPGNHPLPCTRQDRGCSFREISQQGHHLFADSLYSSVPLVNELEKKRTGYTGTLNIRWHQLPSAVRARLNLWLEDVRAWRNGRKMALA